MRRALTAVERKGLNKLQKTDSEVKRAWRRNHKRKRHEEGKTR